MRQRSIHSIAHWTIMTLLLLFPVLMVGVSIFGKESQTIDVTETYEYETNEVNSADDLIVGNIYKVNCDISNVGTYTTMFTTKCFILLDNAYDMVRVSVKEDNAFFVQTSSSNQELGIGYADYRNYIRIDSTQLEMYLVYNTYNFNIFRYDIFSASDYLGEKTVDYVIHNQDYRQDINDWCDAFVQLPVNGWYQSLMNVMGIGLTNNSVMNVIYVMPLYIIWVFILDLVVDIILVIVRLPHKALNKLGGENE